MTTSIRKVASRLEFANLSNVFINGIQGDPDSIKMGFIHNKTARTSTSFVRSGTARSTYWFSLDRIARPHVRSPVKPPQGDIPGLSPMWTQRNELLGVWTRHRTRHGCQFELGRRVSQLKHSGEREDSRFRRGGYQEVLDVLGRYPTSSNIRQDSKPIQY